MLLTVLHICLWWNKNYKGDNFTPMQSLPKWCNHFSFLFLVSSLLGSSQVKHKRQVSFWKTSSPPCLINDWHLCQSIHSATAACNKSHLAGRWADPQRSVESMTSDKHGSLADYQTNTRPRSIRQSYIGYYLNMLNGTHSKTNKNDNVQELQHQNDIASQSPIPCWDKLRTFCAPPFRYKSSCCANKDLTICCQKGPHQRISQPDPPATDTADWNKLH